MNWPWYSRPCGDPILLQSPPKPDYVACEASGVLVLRHMAVKVKSGGAWAYGVGWVNGIDRDLYYCRQFAPKYDEVYRGATGIKYYKRVEVDIDGTPIGYTFSSERGHESNALLLAHNLRQHLYETVRQIRREEYNSGWKDAKRKTKKRDYFMATLGPVYPR